MNYHVKELEKIEIKPGCWNYLRIGVFLDDVQIGEFQKNYHSHAIKTFAPFERNGQWHALYTEDYQHLSVMSLPDCKKIGDEKSSFCPVEVYIPQYQTYKYPATTAEELKKYPEQNHSWLSKDRYEKQYDQELWNVSNDTWICDNTIQYENFAFVSGACWGDDSSWKVELRDISKAHEGIIKNVPEWGYLELPDLPLKDCIHLSAFDYYEGSTKQAINSRITITKTIRLNIDKENDIKLEFFDN